ncbi:MAG TPA: winged helix-turn-helix domain-containing protein [Nitrosopumilaceae archaeon]|nr:winged helix-turn-helix domain-containing protein [Nitrosopumilaceae archaeon]
MKYRSRSDITAMILDSARTGASKTKIMYKAYLSYAQVIEYLKYLQQNDLLAYEEGTQVYRPTEKGLKFLNLTNELTEMTVVASSKNYNML